MDAPYPSPGVRGRDVPNQLERLSVQLEVLAKNISELGERAKPVLSQHPSAKLVDKKDEGIAASTPTGSMILELTRKVMTQNDRLEDIVRELEV